MLQDEVEQLFNKDMSELTRYIQDDNYRVDIEHEYCYVTFYVYKDSEYIAYFTMSIDKLEKTKV